MSVIKRNGSWYICGKIKNVMEHITAILEIKKMFYIKLAMCLETNI